MKYRWLAFGVAMLAIGILFVASTGEVSQDEHADQVTPRIVTSSEVLATPDGEVTTTLQTPTSVATAGEGSTPTGTVSDSGETDSSLEDDASATPADRQASGTPTRVPTLTPRQPEHLQTEPVSRTDVLSVNTELEFRLEVDETERPVTIFYYNYSRDGTFTPQLLLEVDNQSEQTSLRDEGVPYELTSRNVTIRVWPGNQQADEFIRQEVWTTEYIQINTSLQPQHEWAWGN